MMPFQMSLSGKGSLPANTGRKMRFTGITILKVVNGKIVEENGLDDGVTDAARHPAEERRFH
jgi:predicted ester cyclase